MGLPNKCVHTSNHESVYEFPIRDVCICPEIDRLDHDVGRMRSNDPKGS